MYKPISTKTHGVLDYLTAATFIALPRVMGWSTGLTQGMTMLGLGKIGYALLTRHELSLVKKLPMPAHLALDAAGGAALCAMPMLLGDEDDCGAVEACCAMGLFDIVVAPLTQTTMRGAPERTIEHREQSATARENLTATGGQRTILGARPAVVGGAAL